MTAKRKITTDRDDPGYWVRGAMLGSGRLLERLRAEHDANMYPPKDWKPKPVITFAPVKFGSESPICEYVPPTVKKIQEAVAAHFGVPEPKLRGLSRLDKIVRARHVAQYLARELTERSLPEIGRLFGGRDHSSVWHGIDKIKKLLPKDEDLAFSIALLMHELAPALEKSA